MKNLLLTLICCLSGVTGFSQQMGFDVLGTTTDPYAGPYFLITLDTLQDAATLKDINARYREDWVAEYLSVAVASNCDGVVRKAAGTNDRLTARQLEILKTAVAGCRIDVEVEYIPKNNLSYNPPRKMDFSLRPVPVFEAKYPGGAPSLKDYLQKNVMDKVPGIAAGPVKLAKVRFNIDPKGQITDARVVKTSENAGVDKMVLDALCSMPDWMPAKDAQGMAITQEFELSLGTDLLMCDYYQY
ncbi:TonB family protein [Flavilitoribacter nigricans]|uniref:TonB C-terminal domain-containing protein n=1 Tax=Flavilitoribacter nigricans (strain ATCC 23147 / DSM 23189 / NBRC 102662 / NCIMB 1420 / SS-2) TaxID=1122177 RepID=A0A2D0NI26_FLAN2|nr:TonB family protein [Flavilitoribacter nigricans]PHN08164.1 hypothetical protein CRP01_02250 [Flavilitoribacter nigricans DSM 23189 = NBRC 102662]